MPYNNTPIEPSKEITGHVSLPLARVQKIIHADPERLNVSKNAAFAIALATEMFIQYLATATHNVVKTERKPRRNIQYRDVSSAVAKTDNLEFAVDVVPRTMVWKEAKKRREEREEREKMAEAEGVSGKGKAVDGDATNGDGDENGNGNREVVDVDDDTEIVEPSEAEDVSPTPIPNPATAPASAPAKTEEPAPPTDAMDVDERVEDSDPDEDPAAMQLEMEMRGPPRQKTESPEQPKPMATRRSGGFTAINGAK